ncbi:MAG: hypothetical protein RLZZ15_2370 [Verrucomicrobiota bacterium]|jgi:phosphatidylglycerophosphate synthase
MEPRLATLRYRKGTWELVPPGEPTGLAALPTRIGEVWKFHANLIGYARLALVLAAAVALTVPAPFAAAACILVSTLLDWVDGPVARARGECSIFGSGLDWLADVLAQVVTLVWWAQLDVRILPVVLAFTGVEMALSIFDFAVTMTGLYPTYQGKLAQRYNRFFAILDWSQPDGAYGRFGTVLWLAYPLFCLTCCLHLAQPRFGSALFAIEAILLIPALLYMWCETAYLCFILRNWRELPRRTTPSAPDDDHL